MNNNRSIHKAVRQKKRKRRLISFIILPILLITLSGVGYGAYLFIKASNTVESSKQELKRGEQSAKRIEKVNPKHDNISILIMGVDESKIRGSESGTRTDALMLATFNRKDKSVKMVSIPRDSYVYVPAEGEKDKITHAYSYGKEDSTIETVEELLEVPVDYFLKLNFDAFIDVVEALDGIKVDVPVTFSEQDSKDRKDAIHLTEGLQKLNGEEALALARTRHIDNDIERGKRQQLVLRAIIDKALTAGSITKYGDMMEALGDNITTNLEFGEILSLYDYAKAGLDIQSLELKGYDSHAGRAYIWELDKESINLVSDELKKHLGIDSEISDSSETSRP